MNRLLAIAMLCVCGVSSAAADAMHNNTQHHSVSGHKAHLHGVAELTLVQEGDFIEIEFESPAANIVGFEHRATSSREINSIRSARASLEQPAQLFDFGGAGCRSMAAAVDMSALMPVPGSTRDHHHGHDQESGHQDEHSEITAQYRLQCSQMEKLDTLKVKLVSLFPGLDVVRVMWVTDRNQGAVRVTSSSDRVVFR